MSFLWTGSHRTYFEQHGPGQGAPSVIFLHEGLGCTKSWKDLPAKFSRRTGYRTVNYDRRGYGRSDELSAFPLTFLEDEADFLAQFLDSLEIESAHFVGHSDGGTIALLFAASFPDRTESVVAEGPHTFVEAKTRLGLRELVHAQDEEIAWLERLHPGRGLKLFRAWTEVWLSEEHAQWDIRDRLQEIRAPVLVIQGEADEYGTLAQVTEIQQRVSNCDSWILPACGHVPHAEQPGKFLQRICEHVDASRDRS